MHAYQVMGENPNDPSPMPGLIAGQETRFIGRERELDFLEQAILTTMESRLLQLVTITAEPGGGTSRLLYEFERRLQLLPGRTTILRSQAHPPVNQTTLALWRDLVFHYGHLHLPDSPGLMRDKLARHIAGGNLHQHPSQVALDKDAYHLADTLLAAWAEGDGAGGGPPGQESTLVEALIRFLRTVAGDSDTTLVLLLDHLHWADDASLAILEAIVEQPRISRAGELPLLIICTAEPDFLHRRPSWQRSSSDPFAPYHHLDLQPLSAIDARHMLAEALQRLPSPPLRLLDLIAAGARGNPLYLEEMVKLLLNQAIIADGIADGIADSIAGPGSGRWRVDMAQVEAMRLPTTLDVLFRARLEQLPPPERQLLGMAAVVGPIFWDTALLQDSEELPTGDLDASLQKLEQKRLITRNQTWSFAKAQAYTFTHPQLWDAAYNSLPSSRRRALHGQVARWLLGCRQNRRSGNDFPPVALLAHHLEQAGGDVQAAST
jgi:hypothetical protein